MTSRFVVVLLVACGALLHAAPALAGTKWLCDARMTGDVCDGSLSTTVQRLDGTSTVVRPARDAHLRVDCFYVYPTVSGQSRINATRAADPEVVAIARQQAARYGQHCRVFVPLYRQVTLKALFGGEYSENAQDVAYRDVRAAFRAYLRGPGEGRRFVLIGHSQGAFMLKRLIAAEIDRDRALRRRLVAAYLLGADVLVRKGADGGGDFRHVPLCRRDDQTGCAVAFSTFGATPPADARFGRAPAGSAEEVACTNPASLRRNAETDARTVLRGDSFPASLLGTGIQLLFGGPPPTASTPYLVPADRYRIRCTDEDGANVLLATPLPGSRTLNPSPDATWGLHLVDGNVAQGDLVRLLARQARAAESESAVASTSPATSASG